MSLDGLDWIGVDWGTTRLRACAVSAAGAVLACDESSAGMAALEPAGFEAALLALIGGWLPSTGRVEVLAAGMVGSRQGWCEAPYRPVPCVPVAAAKGLTRAPVQDPRLSVRIVAGLCQTTPADVMRGEETQIAGYLVGQPEFDGVICLPGTHSKWVRVSAGEVVGFQTYMTGEIFGLLAGQSVLRHSVAAEGWEPAEFDAAVEEALSRPEKFAARLFALRAEALLSGLNPVAARSRLSGLTIGMELAAARPFWLGQDVAVIGAEVVAGLYVRALASQGLRARVAGAGALTLVGLGAVRAALEVTQ